MSHKKLVFSSSATEIYEGNFLGALKFCVIKKYGMYLLKLIYMQLLYSDWLRKCLRNNDF